MKFPSPQTPPAPPDAVRIPSPTDPDVMAGARAKTADMLAKRRGRDSTKLAGGPDNAYTRTTLG